MLREDRLDTAQADLRRARDTGRTGGVEVDVVGGITGLILGVLVTNVFVATQGRAVVLTWARPGLHALIGSVVGRTPHSGPPQYGPRNLCTAHDQAPRYGQCFRAVVACGHRSRAVARRRESCSRQECHR